MPRLEGVPLDEAAPGVVKLYERVFPGRDPVKDPGTATGTPGNWWTVFALAPHVFDHAVSHMGRMGRPMSPVYQPEIIAEAIHLAAITRRREMSVTFTTVLFSLCSRLMPGLVSRAIRRLGYAGQLAGHAESRARHRPTLFTASDQASPVRGAFDSQARSSSSHVSVLRMLARLTGKAGRKPESVGVRPAEDSSI